MTFQTWASATVILIAVCAAQPQSATGSIIIVGDSAEVDHDLPGAYRRQNICLGNSHEAT